MGRASPRARPKLTVNWYSRSVRGLHEDLDRPLEVSGSSDRSFGLVVGGILVLMSLEPILRGGATRPWPLGVGAALIAVAAARPALLAPLNRLWTRLGLLLQYMTSPVVLGLLFYLTVTPIGLLMRLLGKTPLRLGLEPDARSYWIDRRPPGPAPATMRNQF
jgi:hypothetical protein